MTMIRDSTSLQPWNGFEPDKGTSTSGTPPTDRMARRTSGKQRAASRLLELGPQALSDAELLSLVLRSNGRATAPDLGADLLMIHGSLRALLLADRNAAKSNGLTLSNYASLQATLEIARRHYQELLRAGATLDTGRALREFLRMRMRDLPYEVFAVLYIDNRHRFLQFKELFRGTIDGASVHPREVVRDALTHNAAAVIAVHNHPSGVAEPSQADELITLRLKDALAMVDIRLIDHFIVGDGAVSSLADRGLL